MEEWFQNLVVEAGRTAEALNAKYARPTEMIPVDFLAAGIRNPVIWLEKPNAKVS